MVFFEQNSKTILFQDVSMEFPEYGWVFKRFSMGKSPLACFHFQLGTKAAQVFARRLRNSWIRVDWNPEISASNRLGLAHTLEQIAPS